MIRRQICIDGVIAEYYKPSEVEPCVREAARLLEAKYDGSIDDDDRIARDIEAWLTQYGGTP